MLKNKKFAKGTLFKSTKNVSFSIIYMEIIRSGVSFGQRAAANSSVGVVKSVNWKKHVSSKLSVLVATFDQRCRAYFRDFLESINGGRFFKCSFCWCACSLFIPKPMETHSAHVRPHRIFPTPFPFAPLSPCRPRRACVVVVLS